MSKERKYWEPDIETLPLDKLKKLQEEELQQVVTHAYKRTKLYQRKFDQAGVKPEDIKTLDDLSKLPFTDYVEDFCQTSLEEKLAVPLEDVKQVCSTSGTISGFSQPVCFSQRDAERCCINSLARMFWTMGVRPNDSVQCLSNFTCMQLGIKALGAQALMYQAGRGNIDY